VQVGIVQLPSLAEECETGWIQCSMKDRSTNQDRGDYGVHVPTEKHWKWRISIQKDIEDIESGL
jgi:hypothetical protein